MKINEKNQSGREDRMQGWQPSMKKTAGSDILHRPGDASRAMEATAREGRRGDEGGEEEEEGGGRLGDNINSTLSLRC